MIQFNLKTVFTIIFAVSFVTVHCQVTSFEIKIAPDVTFPLGKLKEQFWHFPEDSNTTFKNIRVKKQALPGFFFSPEAKFLFKNKKAVTFSLETGLSYYFKRYNVSWQAQSESANGTGSFNAEYKITRHEAALNILPGLVYKKLSISAGLDFLFLLNTSTAVKFLRNGNSYINYKTNNRQQVKTAASSVINLSMPVFISYSVFTSNKFNISPFVSYNFGIGDFDLYEINWNRNEVAYLSELMAGVYLNFVIK